MASRFTAKHDVVLVGYRGVDGSTRLDCPEVSSAMGHSRDLLGEQSFRADARGVPLAVLGRPAPQRWSPISPAIRSPKTVDDLEVARRALGYHQIDLVSEKRRHPYRDDLHLAVPAQHQPIGHARRQPARQLHLEPGRRPDEQIGRYAALCAQATSWS